MKRIIWALVLGGALLAAVVSVAEAQAPSYGMVDMARVEGEYKGMQQIKDQFEAYTQEQQSKLIAREKVMMLADADYTRYFDKSQAAAPTEANKKELADLEAAASAREQKLRDLMANKSRTPEEQKEYDELNGVYTARLGELQKLKDDLDKQVQAKGDELMKLANDSVTAAVKAVAEQKKLTAVFLKQALLYGGVDITDEVLAKLNAPAPAAPAAPAK